MKHNFRILIGILAIAIPMSINAQVKPVKPNQEPKPVKVEKEKPEPAKPERPDRPDKPDDKRRRGTAEAL